MYSTRLIETNFYYRTYGSYHWLNKLSVANILGPKNDRYNYVISPMPRDLDLLALDTRPIEISEPALNLIQILGWNNVSDLISLRVVDNEKVIIDVKN